MARRTAGNSLWLIARLVAGRDLPIAVASEVIVIRFASRAVLAFIRKLSCRGGIFGIQLVNIRHVQQVNKNVEQVNTHLDFPTRIKALRLEAKLTQAQFAEKMFLSRGLLNGLETGRETPSKWIVQQVDILERAGVAFLDKIAPDEVSDKFTVNEDALSGLSATSTIAAEVRKLFEQVIQAAEGDAGRLAWLREQIKAHLATPAHWKAAPATPAQRKLRPGDLVPVTLPSQTILLSSKTGLPLHPPGSQSQAG
jgi:transcriptional regulator with XRE-family HTH domain